MQVYFVLFNNSLCYFRASSGLLTPYFSFPFSLLGYVKPFLKGDIKLIHCEEAVPRAKINKKLTFKINPILEIRNVAQLPVEGAQYYIEP